MSQENWVMMYQLLTSDFYRLRARNISRLGKSCVLTTQCGRLPRIFLYVQVSKSQIPHTLILLTLLIALQWIVDNRIYLRGSMNEIIYELTGVIRSKQAIALHFKKFHDKQKPRQHWRSLAKKDSVLIDRLRKTKGQVEKIHKDFNCAHQAFQGVDFHFSALVQAFQSVLDIVSQLSTAQLLSKPNPTLNSDVNILREISHMVADDSSDFDIELAAPLPAKYFSLTSVSRFYRLEALPILASSIVYDFGSKTDTLHDFCNCLSPDSQRYLKNVKITMVEGFMGFMLPCNLNTPLTPGCTTLSTYINTILPALRVLNIDLWPRTPTRTDTESRAWGQESEDLLRSLTTDAKATVRLEMRWAADCERFEREYVRGGAWVRVWREESEEMESGNGEMCHRFYETRGGG